MMITISTLILINYEIYRFNIGRAFGSLFNKYAIRVLRVNPLFDNSIFCMDGASIIQRCNDNLTLVYVAVAILFQPFLKITLSKEIWNVVDVLTAGWLVYLYVKNMNLTKKP